MKKIFLLLTLLASIYCRAQIPSFEAIAYDSSAVKGYFFLESQEHLIILDKEGSPVYYSHKLTGTDGDFKIQPNGEMTYYDAGKFRIMDSTFTIIDSVFCKNYETDFHEIMILPNGHFLLMGRQDLKMDLSKYHWKGEHGTDTTHILNGIIQEQDADRNVVFEWSAIDHFAYDDVDTNRYAIIENYWIHWNSLDLDKDGNILVSSRNFNEVTKINRKDGSIMWRLGGKRNQFKFINSPIPFYGQRNIKVLPNGDITFYDGGNGPQPHGARAMEFKLDERKKTAALKWSYTYGPSLMSIMMGNVQRLGHSNTLVDFGGASDKFNLCLVIVDSSGKKLFQLNGPTSFRTYYYETLPFELRRPQITCFDSIGVHYLDAGAGYSSYKWSTGDSTRAIAITKTGSYSVFVPFGDEGFISSEKVMVTDMGNPCAALSGRTFTKMKDAKKEK